MRAANKRRRDMPLSPDALRKKGYTVANKEEWIETICTYVDTVIPLLTSKLTDETYIEVPLLQFMSDWFIRYRDTCDEVFRLYRAAGWTTVYALTLFGSAFLVLRMKKLDSAATSYTYP